MTYFLVGAHCGDLFDVVFSGEEHAFGSVLYRVGSTSASVRLALSTLRGVERRRKEHTED